jgi:manganese-dependent inorganic pyrophosphatase
MSPAASAPTSNITYIIGHKNPDADSICSALAYAAYKEARGEKGYIAARCGNSNARIDTILTRFGQSLPVYVSDVSPRVLDLMIADFVSVSPDATCAEALELIDRHDIRQLPVIDSARQVIGTISLAHLGGIFIPRLSEPRSLRQVNSSLTHIVRSLQATAHHLVAPELIDEYFIRVGAMDVATFWTISERDNIPANRSLIIVGDRRDIQARAITLGVRAIIITGGIGVDDDILRLAQSAGVSIISSPWDSATTALGVRTATTIDRVIEKQFTSFHPDARLADIRRKISAMSAPAAMVLDDNGALVGVISKSDILKPVQTRLVLVDHNEMTQAVSGAEEVTITEIIDHHRLGSLNTPQPILFINEPVGSTCTIIADLFRRENLQPSPAIAGIMMSGLISDTLHLNGPTSTRKDAILLAWLAEIAGVNSKQLADEIFNSGSVILANSPEKIVRSDFKIYEEEGQRFAVSQVEELGFGNFWQHANPISAALLSLREDEGLAFAALLVTDINTQNSLLLVKGDASFIQRISYAHVEQDEIFDLPGIVSRKKQLIPYLTSLLKEMSADGNVPNTRSKVKSAKRK